MISRSNETIQQTFMRLDGERQALLQRCEEYSMWTLPYLFPQQGNTIQNELPVPAGSIGARATNHLANVIVQTMFPATQMFFRASLNQSAKSVATELNILGDVERRLAELEQTGQELVTVPAHRSTATEAAKHIIVLGNALLMYPKAAKGAPSRAIVYNFRDWVCKRNFLGDVICIITRDKKIISALPQSVQETLMVNKGYTEPDQLVTLYTKIEYEPMLDKFIITQTVDDVPANQPAFRSKDSLRWIVITWHRAHGEDYGRGLVEDYARAFASYTTNTTSRDLITAIAADIKRFVDPSSSLDVDDLNQSEPGEYLAAKRDEVWMPDFAKQFDLGVVNSTIAAHEQTIAQAFMLSTAMTRDAERVTAEEIKMQIKELETSHGGVYSHLASEWQEPLARILLEDMGLLDENIRPTIITGIEALGRTADMEKLYAVLNDLRAASEVRTTPFGRWIDEAKFINHVCTQRGFNMSTVFKPAEQVAQEDQLAAQQRAEDEQRAISAGAMSEVNEAEL